MTSHVRAIDVPGLAPPAPHYADVVVAGNLLFVSGILPLDEAGQLVGPGDAGLQTARILDILCDILHHCGATVSDVAKLTVFLTDLGCRAAVNSARIACFAPHRPASTLVQVSGLIASGAIVEIDALAVMP